MARVNQGAYKKYLDKFKKLEESYESVIADAYEHNGDDEMFTGDRMTAWWFLENADEIYRKMGKLKTKLEDMLETQKFESDDIKNKYEEKIGSVTFSMGRDCIAAVPCQGIGFRLAKGDLDRNRHLCFVC